MFATVSELHTNGDQESRQDWNTSRVGFYFCWEANIALAVTQQIVNSINIIYPSFSKTVRSFKASKEQKKPSVTTYNNCMRQRLSHGAEIILSTFPGCILHHASWQRESLKSHRDPELDEPKKKDRWKVDCWNHLFIISNWVTVISTARFLITWVMRLQKGPERHELSPHPNSLHYKEKKTLKKPANKENSRKKNLISARD